MWKRRSTPPRPSATTGCSGRPRAGWRRRPSPTARPSSACSGSRGGSSPATCAGATRSEGRSDKIGGMIVLGITETHCATAAILRDGAIVGCASEERFTRLKNDAGYPRRAIDALLRELSLTPRDIDLVALAGTRAYERDWMNRVLHDADYAREYYGVRLEERARGLGRRARKLGARLGLAERSRGKFELTERERLALVTDHLGLERSRIVAYDHHLCHAAAAYYGSPFAGERALVLTNDNAGDGLCATVSTGRGTALVRHEAVPSVQDSLLAWARLMRERHGGERLALGGGVFMNVKANGLIAEEPWLRDLFVFPSCGDESNAIGAAYLGWLARAGVGATPQPFGPAYLGPSIDPASVETLIRSRDLASRYRVTEHERIEERIAELLVADGVVARCAGRMEFGARALGNRSILANPSDHRVVGTINRMIKNRDFWMPFAPSILREREDDYVVNPKGLASPYMMLAFATNPKRRDEITAALHPHDATARAHLVDEAWNPAYHRVLREFERRTGIGAVLNTSFNLHGEPLVGSPEDAVDTFERSGLSHLALDRWMISKK